MINKRLFSMGNIMIVFIKIGIVIKELIVVFGEFFLLKSNFWEVMLYKFVELFVNIIVKRFFLMFAFKVKVFKGIMIDCWLVLGLLLINFIWW